MRRWIVWSSIGSFLLIDFLMFLRFFLPRSIFEPSSVFRIGVPADLRLELTRSGSSNIEFG